MQKTTGGPAILLPYDELRKEQPYADKYEDGHVNNKRYNKIVSGT
jgi:hypothetical protein